ncbi:MAG: ATPase [Betaproteobacteria bacterium HGW-Betaproteobacteria-12]|nr:MAG: ATPase [Betaproteobacteria bacterium HGW-Betaproteobacteria-12]
MYEAFYGLTSKPFQLNPDPSFYFGSKQHKRAAAYLEYGMHQNEGFIVITGEVGAGKTTIVRGMLDGLDQKKVVAAHLVSTQLDADDTLRLVGAAFGLRTKDVSKADVLMSLEAFLISATSKGKRCLLIVDEAQNLTARAVEELRMLSNFQFGNHALLQSYLIGQPEFRQILQSPHMMQFRQRVIAACHIGPLDVEETRAYIEHRLKCAGSSGQPVINAGAHEAIFKASSGIPRRINSVCDRLLLFGFLSGKKDFDEADVEEVAREIHDETMGGNTQIGIGYAPATPQALSPYQAGSPQAGSLTGDPAALLASLNVQQFGERLGRLERSLMQLEKINGTTLELLQQLVANGRHLTPPAGESEKADA